MQDLGLQNQDSNFCEDTINEAKELLTQEIDMNVEENRDKVEETISGLVVCARSTDESCNNEEAFNTLAVLVQHVKANIEEYIWWEWVEPFRKQVQYIIDHKEIQKDEKQAA